MAERWRVLLVLCVARIAMGFQFQSIGATAGPLQREFGIDLAYVGWLVGLYMLPGLVLALPSGLLGARFGERRAALLGLAMMVAGGAALALAQSPQGLIAGRIVCGIGGVLYSVMVTKMVADWFAGKELVLAMSLMVNTWPIGIALALFVLGPVSQHLGAASAFGITAALGALSFLLVSVGYRPAPSAAKASLPRLSAISRDEWILLAIAGLAWMTFNVVYAVLATFLPVYLVESGIDATQASALTGLNSLMIVFSIPAGGYVAHRLGRPDAVALVGLVGFCVALAAMLMVSAGVVVLLACGFFLGLAAGYIASFPAQFLRPETRATGAGVSATIFYLGVTVLPGPIGYAAQRQGSAAVVLVIAIGLALLTMGLVVAFPVVMHRLMAVPGKPAGVVRR